MAATWLQCQLDYHIVLIEINMWSAVWAYVYECTAIWILKIDATHLHNCILWRLPSDNSTSTEGHPVTKQATIGQPRLLPAVPLVLWPGYKLVELPMKNSYFEGKDAETVRCCLFLCSLLFGGSVHTQTHTHLQLPWLFSIMRMAVFFRKCKSHK